jgi:hypothetical protein
VIGCTTLVLAILTNLGTGNQEGYQILQSASGIAYGFTYLVMFAIPIAARGEKRSWLLLGAAASGFAMTLLNVLTSVFPIIDVQQPLIFALKVGGTVVALNLVAALFYLRAAAARQTHALSAAI